ncbi:unnamed protein product [Urochloa humidicola]
MALGGGDPGDGDGVERESHAAAPIATRGVDLGVQYAAERGDSFESPIAPSREDGIEGHGSSNLLSNGKGAISMQQASTSSCYPFMNPEFFRFQTRGTNALTLQDMVVQASNGVLDSGAIYQTEVCNDVNTVCLPSNVILADTIGSEHIDGTYINFQQESASGDW